MKSQIDMMVDWLSADPERIKRRETFYALRSGIDAIRQRSGLGSAMGASAELYARCFPKDFDGLNELTCGIRDILEPDFPDDELEDLNDILTNGRPRWHRVPWARKWLAATADTSQVAAFWQQNEAATQPRDLAYSHGLLKSFTETPNPGLDELAKLILEFIEENGRPPRLLDIGCGVGNWLVFLVKYCGVDPKFCYGIDQLPGRIRGAQALGETVGIPPNNFMVSTIELPRGLEPEIVMLCAVAGCMEDTRLDDLLYRVADMGSPPRTVGAPGPARYIFESGVLDSWSAWIGRSQAQMDAHFSKIGYKPLRSKLTGSVLTRENLASLVCPLKYYDSGRCTIYAREDAAMSSVF